MLRIVLSALLLAAPLCCQELNFADDDLPQGPPFERQVVHHPPPLLLIDATYTWRVKRQGWHDLDAMLRMPLGALLTGSPKPWQFGARGMFSQGHGRADNPRRYGIAAVVAFGAEWYSPGPGPGGFSLCDGSFPLARSTAVAAGALLEVGWVQSRGIQADAKATQNAIRIGQSVHLGIVALQIRAHGAVEVPLEDGTDSWDAGIQAELGRPILPVGIVIGYRYHGYQRAGGHAMIIGVTIAL
jgi:hypothetical protein